MAASLGQGEWSVRTCMLKTEPKTLDSNIRIFGGFYASCGRGEELQEIFLFIFLRLVELRQELNEERRDALFDPESSSWPITATTYATCSLTLLIAIHPLCLCPVSKILRSESVFALPNRISKTQTATEGTVPKFMPSSAYPTPPLLLSTALSLPPLKQPPSLPDPGGIA